MNPLWRRSESDQFMAAQEPAYAWLRERGEPWLRELRDSAWEQLRRLGLPTTRREEWRYTDVAPLLEFATPLPNGTPNVTEPDNGWHHLEAHRKVLVNGVLTPALSAVGVLSRGVQVAPLTDLVGHPAVQAHLGQVAEVTEDAFCALNTALSRDTLCLLVPRGVHLEAPFHVEHLAAGGLCHPRVLLVVGEDSEVTLIESYSGGDAGSWTNAVTEVVLAPGAQVDHYTLQSSGEGACHVGTLAVSLAENSKFHSLAAAFSGRLVRHTVRVRMQQPGGECTLNGLVLADGNRHVDNHTVMDHASPGCNSHELYLGVLAGASRHVFNGRILVRPGAVKTDARQTCRNLLLSRQAEADARPQLEIFADDVKCTHGATVGELDADALFYLRTRGIGEAGARALLTLAFASAVLEEVRPRDLRAALQSAVLARLGVAGAEDFAAKGRLVA